MSIATLEREIARNVGRLINNPKFKAKDIREWVNQEEACRKNLTPEEDMIFDPSTGLYVAFLKSMDRRGGSR